MSILACTLGWATLATAVVATSPVGAQQTPASPVSPRPALYVALYERGPAWDTNKAVLEQPGINEHMKFLQANVSVLLGAAPFQQGLAQGSVDRTVGMVIVMAATQDEAERLIAKDPALAAKLMQAAVRRWLAERVRAY